jgi:hypothetical protein
MTSNDDEMRSRILTEIQAIGGKARAAPKGQRDGTGTWQIRAKSALAKKSLTVRLNLAAVAQFKRLAGELGMTQEAAMAEALNLLFKKYSEPEIA